MLLNQFWKYIDFEINQKKCLTRKITIRMKKRI